MDKIIEFFKYKLYTVKHSLQNFCESMNPFITVINHHWQEFKRLWNSDATAGDWDRLFESIGMGILWCLLYITITIIYYICALPFTIVLIFWDILWRTKSTTIPVPYWLDWKNPQWVDFIWGLTGPPWEGDLWSITGVKLVSFVILVFIGFQVLWYPFNKVVWKPVIRNYIWRRLIRQFIWRNIMMWEKKDRD